jgi:hypothetical protein
VKVVAVNGILVPPERPAKMGNSSFDRLYVMGIYKIEYEITGHHSENESHWNIRSQFQE